MDNLWGPIGVADSSFFHVCASFLTILAGDVLDHFGINFRTVLIRIWMSLDDFFDGYFGFWVTFSVSFGDFWVVAGHS